MFKLVVLSALFALVAAKPGYLSPVVGHSSSVIHGAPLIHSSPLVSGYSTSVVSAHVPTVAVVKSVPSAVSHQSSTVVHSKPAVVAVAPVHVAPVHVAPAVHIAPAVSYVKQVAPISYSVPVVSGYSSHGLVGAHDLGYAGHSGLVGAHGLGYSGHSGLVHGW